MLRHCTSTRISHFSRFRSRINASYTPNSRTVRHGLCQIRGSCGSMYKGFCLLVRIRSHVRYSINKFQIRGTYGSKCKYFLSFKFGFVATFSTALIIEYFTKPVLERICRYGSGSLFRIRRKKVFFRFKISEMIQVNTE
jgi:hypothetical protein